VSTENQPQGGGGQELTGHQLSGGLYALGAFSIWGLFPVYFKLLGSLTAYEILAHRVVWAVVILIVLISAFRYWPRVLHVLTNRKLFLTLLVSSILVSLNWGLFIWAVTNDQVLQSSLGYFINPLVNVLLGVLFLKERLFKVQWIAVVLVVIAVLNMGFSLGVIPWISLAMAFSFGMYGLIRKVANVDAFTGLFIETLLVVPVALVYLYLLVQDGTSQFGTAGIGFDVMITMSGLVTVLALVFFAQATKRLQLSTVGFFQYIAPTGHFVLAVYVYNEPFTTHHLITFLLIWTGLAMFTYDSFKRLKTQS